MTNIEVRVPDSVWNTVLDRFAQNQPGVECVAYLDGYRVDEAGYPNSAPDRKVFIAVTAVVPDAILRPRNYAVPAAAVSEAGQHLRAERMIRVAQVHSHGTDWVEHSTTDDDDAYSQQIGAVSVVVPFHGVTRPALSVCGVHLRTESGWRRVEPNSVIKVVPAVLDFRSSTWEVTQNLSSSGGIFSRFLVWMKTALRRPGRSE